LDQFASRWDEKYSQISRSWRTHWDNICTLFKYLEDIRKAIYTTNAIESLNSVIRKAIKKRKLLPTDDSAKKVIFLAIQEASKNWTMPIKKLESCFEPVYDRIRRSIDWICLIQAVTQFNLQSL